MCGRLLCTKVSRFRSAEGLGGVGKLYKFTAAAARVAIANAGGVLRGV